MTNDTPDVTSVPDLNLERYAGLWYEIGRLPLKFEDEHGFAHDGTTDAVLAGDLLFCQARMRSEIAAENLVAQFGDKAVAHGKSR